jgi:hypothetical protein
MYANLVYAFKYDLGVPPQPNQNPPNIEDNLMGVPWPPPLSANAQQDDSREFSYLFNVLDMERLVSIEFKWTNNLLEHLCIKKDSPVKFKTTVFLCHHATFLRAWTHRYILRVASMETSLMTAKSFELPAPVSCTCQRDFVDSRPPDAPWN